VHDREPHRTAGRRRARRGDQVRGEAASVGASGAPLDGGATFRLPFPATRETPLTKVTPFLMFNDQLEAAMEFYTATFPDSEIRNVARTGEDGPITSAELVVGGQVFMGYNGGAYFTFSEGFSLYVDCEVQAEVDEYWDKLVKAGATPTQCGWIKDPFGLTWQIVPRRFMELIRDNDARRVKAVMEAMMTMVKLDVAALERAYNEA
jgi:predicted 3-demethylubiquinone-9 3-methyltransferase (glyoxalase superfamily)